MSIYDTTILIVDDEINNIRLLQGDLEDAGYENLLTARDGVEAWGKIQEHKSEIGLVLLDRMMPNMDGMQVLANVRAHPEIRYIPVIMQTAAAAKEQMLEGIAAGAYYYLTKPYDEETMLAIVAAALRDYESFTKMREDIHMFKRKIHLIQSSHFMVQTIDDARYLGTFLAGFFPDPERSVLGISELLINAIEHGNLGISYEEKSALLKENRWTQEVERRLSLSENREKYVDVYYTRETDKITLHIKDRGKGFDWQRYLEIDPERATHNHGRGIAMARMTSFDTLEYRGTGNEVYCTASLASAGTALKEAS